MQTQLQSRLDSKRPLFSVEFFPPKSEAVAETLLNTARTLQAYCPDFVSITYGAGGSTRDRTLKYARSLSKDYGFEVMPHLTCVGHSRQELIETIEQFKASGFGQIMALRGDPPKGESDFKPHPEGLHHANELVELIKEVYEECTIAVAGYPEKHPEAATFEIDLQNLKRKVDAGAAFITTQLFFDNEVYFDFVSKCRKEKIDVPIIPGIMSITSYKQAKRFCEMCGTRIPQSLEDSLLSADGNTEAEEAIGIDWSFQQCLELLQKGAPGIHLYILNKARPAVALMERLKSAGQYQ